MTVGSPLKIILQFAIPVMLGTLFQQFYSMVDTIIVGKFLGVDALAGVGSTGSINFMVIGFCNGVCSGFAVPVAQQFGAGDERGLRRYVGNAVWLSAMFAGIPLVYLYNLTAGIIRAMGDSKTPLYFLIMSSCLNIVLDLFCILVLEMGVSGAAVATVLSQFISGGCCPEPHRWVVAVTTHKVAYVAIDALLETRVFLVPELPARYIVDYKETELIASVHKCGVLWAVGITDHLQPDVAQLFGIAPMCRVGYGVAHDCKVLMAVCSNERLCIVLAIEVETLRTLELDGADTDATTIAIYYLAALIEHTHIEVPG